MTIICWNLHQVIGLDTLSDVRGGNPHEGVKTSTFHGSMQGSSVTLDNKIKEAEESCRKKPRSRIQIQEF